MSSLRSRLALPACVAVALALPGPASADDATSAEAIAKLNAQRQLNGLPAGITENAYQTRGCANHIDYMNVNGVFDHGEEPGRPGYTDEGADTGGAEVLSQGGGWKDVNPWQNAPIHLFLMMDPTVTQAGYADDGNYACMRFTSNGAFDPAVPPQAFSLPGPGVRDVPVEQTAAEFPYTPQQLVGIPDGRETGPNIMLFTTGMGSTRAVSSSLTGPNGPIDARMVDGQTRNEVGDGSWFYGGGVLIPVRPLDPETTYEAHVLWESLDIPGRQVDQRFSFTTEIPTRVLKVSLGSRLDRRGRVKVKVPAAAVGQTAEVTLQPEYCGRSGRCSRFNGKARPKTITLKRAQSLKLIPSKPNRRKQFANGGTVTVNVATFKAGGFRYLDATATRSYRGFRRR